MPSTSKSEIRNDRYGRRREKYLPTHKRNRHERKIIENAEKSVNPVRIGKEERIARLN